MLGLALQLFDEHPEAAQVRDRFNAFTVDEYQDWLDPRDPSGQA